MTIDTEVNKLNERTTNTFPLDDYFKTLCLSLCVWTSGYWKLNNRNVHFTINYRISNS